MVKFNLGYSLKNIPYPPIRNFIKDLTSRTIDFVRRLRWKAFFFERDSNQDQAERVETFGFKSKNSPPKNELLNAFEEDLFSMIRKVKYRKGGNDNLQQKMKKDVEEIRHTNCVLVKADKSRNIYKVPKEKYKKLLKEQVTKTYRTDKLETVNAINEEAYDITRELKIEDRVSAITTKDSYLLLKDHKNNFQNSLPTRLINPSKTEVGKISKNILERINKEVRKCTNYNQWICTNDAIQWFNGIQDKGKTTFIQFDIVDYYPSICEKTFDEAINFAKQFTEISERDIRIIKHCRRTVLKCNEEIWIKKDKHQNFDVPMGSYDSCEVSDLIGLYVLSVLNRFMDAEHVGLYRDDGLISLVNSNGPLASKTMKRVSRALKSLGFKSEIEGNIKIVNFLDVTFNLEDGSYGPFSKDNQEPLYVSRYSNHPHCILKQIPNSINERLTRNSSSKKTFDQVKSQYEAALEKSGYKNKLMYIENNKQTQKKKKNRSRRIIWYNPPYCRLVNINIGKVFIKLVNKHFPKDNPLHKIFNKNNLKVSYSCTANMDRIIDSHNKKILSEKNERSDETKCNCRTRSKCPLENNCNQENTIYMATVSTTKETNDDKKFYIGAAMGKWKNRYYNHKTSFNVKHHENDTALSKFIWDLKSKNKTPIIKWQILCHAKPPNGLNAKCQICLEEAYRILVFPCRESLLNRRNELFSKCRHIERYKLKPKYE